MTVTRVTLDENEIPSHWYNVVADMPNPPSRRWGRTATRSAPSRCWRSSPVTCLSKR